MARREDDSKSAVMSALPLDSTIPTLVSATRRERDVRLHSLLQIEGAGTPQEFTLTKAEIVLGRADDADVRVDSQRTSRHHATLTLRGGQYTVRDRESRNGVLLNGLRIHSAVLHDGDVLQLADCVFLYREG